MTTRKGYLSDVSDDEWAFVAPYLTLMREDAPQREHSLREVFNGLRYIVHTGMQWRMMPHDLPPWHTVYQQTQRWLKAGVFEDMVHDLRMLLREINDRMQQRGRRFWIAGRCSRRQKAVGVSAGTSASAAKARRCTWPSTLWASCWRAWSLLRTSKTGQVGELTMQIQEVTGDSVEVALVDQGYTGDKTAAAAGAHGIRLEVVKLSTAKRGFVLLPRRWVVERSFGWMARSRRLVCDYERLAETLIGLHFVAFAILLAKRFVTFMVQSA